MLWGNEEIQRRWKILFVQNNYGDGHIEMFPKVVTPLGAELKLDIEVDIEVNVKPGSGLMEYFAAPLFIAMEV
ncbi:hypothetical protein ETB97_012917 [Aspergillus alliaceus]|uniref:Uncharacterized protein n=1 Tax=Petromyces alliaceus TaxID=209559 RepID=A0A8H6E7J0_PETAA|nr:hypothetical protein ETB97_012917 [Aspergillus burnettii]